MQTNDFNLAGLIDVWQRRRSAIMILVVSTVVIAGIILWWMPRQYKSTAVIIAANPQLQDKGRLFNKEIQLLYAVYGGADDLDRLYGWADLDSNYYALIDEFDLMQQYRVTEIDSAYVRHAVLKRLRKDIQLIRTEEQQLKIDVYMKEPQLAADVANAIVRNIDQRFREVAVDRYTKEKTAMQASLQATTQQYTSLTDSIKLTQGLLKESLLLGQLNALEAQSAQLTKNMAELDAAIKANPPALYIQQHASPNHQPARPQVVVSLLAVAASSLVFGLLLTALIDQRRA
jgi:uncharacterized protein involved in exopolysaccharide biosynthesis